MRKLVRKCCAARRLLADAVRVTLGPKSKSVLIERQYGRPLVCNDGVTIVKELTLDDPEENLGVQVLRQAAERTGDLVGDGTLLLTEATLTDLPERKRQVPADAEAA